MRRFKLNRSTQRNMPRVMADEERLTEGIIELAREPNGERLLGPRAGPASLLTR